MDRLPQTLQALFVPRPPIIYAPPLDRDPGTRRGPIYDGVAHLMDQLQTHDPDYKPWETAEEKRLRKKEEKAARASSQVEEGLSKWKPHDDPNATGDPFKTLFVGRLNYNTTEKALVKEFEYYGPVLDIKLVRNKQGVSRGYAFIEFEREKDMKVAFKEADGYLLDGRRIVVDVERGRTVKGWKPRRLGGGLGHTRAGGKDVNQSYAGRENPNLKNLPQDVPSFHDRRGPRGGYGDDRFSRGGPSGRRDDFRGGAGPRRSYGGGHHYSRNGPPSEGRFGSSARRDFGPPKDSGYRGSSGNAPRDSHRSERSSRDDRDRDYHRDHHGRSGGDRDRDRDYENRSSTTSGPPREDYRRHSSRSPPRARESSSRRY